MTSQKDIGSLCRIKVNKMLSSLNSNKNIFIPKYTISNRNEEKYSYLTKSKGKSIKTNHNIKNNNTNNKPKMNQSNIITTEENYTKQPIDFIINHDVLIYQRNFKGEEVVNLGINNEYLRKNKFNMVKNDNTIYQTDSYFRHKNNYSINDNSSKQSHSIQKRLKLNYSRKTLSSMSDMPLTKNKNNSNSQQKKILSTNLNTTQNSISSMNSINVKNFLASSKNKIGNNKKKINTNLNVKNPKKVINFVRRKKKSNTEQGKLLIFRKNKNNSTFTGNDENIRLNNKTDIKDNNIIPHVIDNKYYTAYNNKNNIQKIENNKITKLIDAIISPKNQEIVNKDINLEIDIKIHKLYKSIDILIKYYLKIYYNIMKNNISEKIKLKNEYIDKIDINYQSNDKENKIVKININKIILDKCKQKKCSKNSFYSKNEQKHQKSNSIIVNKKLSSNSTNVKEMHENHSNHNLSLLISKNLRFFSNDKYTNNKNETRKSELYRDSKSLQKKYEQICRRKKKDLTMTFPRKLKNNNYDAMENNNNFIR